ncbi:hypothetical protein SDC49_03170 [Lactobacillus sp. R2/2]|nr:hypothetical protein [Lactobacillus sp. R2/2]
MLFFLEERWLLLFLPDLIHANLLPNKNIEISGFADSSLISSIWPSAKMILQDPYKMGQKLVQSCLIYWQTNKTYLILQWLKPVLLKKTKKGQNLTQK